MQWRTYVTEVPNTALHGEVYTGTGRSANIARKRPQRPDQDTANQSASTAWPQRPDQDTANQSAAAASAGETKSVFTNLTRAL